MIGNFKKLRESLGKTLMQISLDLDMATGTYSQYENGTREPNFETLFKIADYFNVTTDYLLGRTTINSPPVDIDTELAYQINRLLQVDTKKALLVLLGKLEKSDSPTMFSEK